MNKADISIATITLARDAEEERLLRESLLKLSKLNIPVFITDGGSRRGFADFLRSFPHFILSQTIARGVWEQAKNSISEACRTGSKSIFYTEPDKFDFFKNGLVEMLSSVQPDDKTGIVMACRSPAGFATFPAFQRMTETTINNCCAEIMGNNFDYTYGPFLLNRHLAPYLNLVQEDIGWGWRPYMFGIAQRLGYKVEAFPGDFYCPLSQRIDTSNERVYRMRQLNQNIQGIVLSASVEID